MCPSKSEKGHPAPLPFPPPPESIIDAQCKSLRAAQAAAWEGEAAWSPEPDPQLFGSLPPQVQPATAPPSGLDPVARLLPTGTALLPLLSWETRLKLFKRNLY